MTNNPVRKLIDEIPCYSILTEEQKLTVQNSSYIISYASGDALFRHSTPVSHIMFVHSGLVKIFKTQQTNRTFIFDFISSGKFVALLTIFSRDLYHYNATAVEDSEVLLTDISVIRKIILENGEFASLLLKETSEEGLGISMKFMSLFQKQLPGRVAEMLLFFSEEIYHSQKFSIPLSRRELAEFIGTTKESMIRTLAEFKHDKIIKLEGQEVEIISIDIVQALGRFG